MLAHLSTIAGETRVGASKASPSAFRSLHDFQRHGGLLSFELSSRRVSQIRPHQSDARVPPPSRARQWVRLSPRLGRTHVFSQTIGSRRWLDISLRNEPFVKLARYAAIPHRLSSRKSSLRPNQYGRSEKAWRYQIPVMRCPT